MEEPDSAGKTPFLVAMEEGRERCADYLLKNNCNVDTMDKLGQTALYLGVICFHGSASENVRKLLKSGNFFIHFSADTCIEIVFTMYVWCRNLQFT